MLSKILRSTVPNAVRACQQTSVRCMSDSNRGPWYDLSSEQKSYLEMAEKFSKEVIAPNAAHYDKTGEFPWDIVKEAHKLGLMTGGIDVQYGGLGMSLLESCIVSEKLAWGCSGISTAITGNGLGYAPLMVYGTDAQKKKYLGWCAAEPIICSYAVTEPGAGSDVNGVKTKAEKTKDGD